MDEIDSIGSARIESGSGGAREYPIYCSFFEIHKFIFPKNVDSTMKVQTLSLVFFDISTHDQYYCQYEKYLYIVNGANGAFTTRNIRLCVANNVCQLVVLNAY